MTDCLENMAPKGWQRCVLPDFTCIVMGQSPSSKTYNRSGSGLPFFQGKAEFGDLFPTINLYCSQPNKIAKQGATLLSVRAPVGPTNLAEHECCIGRGLAALHPCGGIKPKFLLYLFRSIEPVISVKGTGSTFKAITKGFVEGLEFNLPPLPEQHRIVAKIEELFSELDKGVESLKTTRAKLNVYRQTVLKHAFEGKLTVRWREENKDKLETPEQLLARIKQERAACYEQQLQKWKTAVNTWEANGKLDKKPTKPQNPRNPLCAAVSPIHNSRSNPCSEKCWTGKRTQARPDAISAISFLAPPFIGRTRGRIRARKNAGQGKEHRHAQTLSRQYQPSLGEVRPRKLKDDESGRRRNRSLLLSKGRPCYL